MTVIGIVELSFKICLLLDNIAVLMVLIVVHRATPVNVVWSGSRPALRLIGVRRRPNVAV